MASLPYIRPVLRRTIPIPVPVPPIDEWYFCPDRQEYQILKDNILYDGETGRPLFNRSTNEYYVG